MSSPVESSKEFEHANDAEREYLWKERSSVLLKIELSALYHLKRERFFELLDKISKAISVIGGSAALWKSTQNHGNFLEIVASIITVTSALSLVLSFSDRSRRHSEFARNYRKILIDVHKKGSRGFNEEDLNQWMAQICEIEMGEPLALSTLVIICQNELAVARDAEEVIVPIPFWKRMFAHFFDMPMQKK